MDASSGQVLWSKNMHSKEYPASITKILTAYLVAEYLSPDETMVMSRHAVFSIPRGSCHIALNEGEEIKVGDALSALMTVSANDAANGLAEHIGSTIEGFARIMNEKAASIGAVNSNFVNPSGLSDDNHYTTPYDMALITYHAYQNPIFREYFNISSTEMPATNLQPEVRYFNNQHEMIYLPKAGKYPCEGVVGGKLGWTRQALNTMVTVAQRDGRTLIAVVMKCASASGKYTDTVAMLDYGFDHFNKHVLSADKLSLFAKGESARQWQVEENFGFLLHEDFSLEQVQMDLQEEGEDVSLLFSLADTGGIMHEELGSLALSPSVSAASVAQASLEDEPMVLSWHWWYIFPLAFILLGLGVLIVDMRRRRYYYMRRQLSDPRRLFR